MTKQKLEQNIAISLYILILFGLASIEGILLNRDGWTGATIFFPVFILGFGILFWSVTDE